MRVHDPLARELGFELLVAAFAGFDELPVGSHQRIHIPVLRRLERRLARVAQRPRPFLPTIRLRPNDVVSSRPGKRDQGAGCGHLRRMLFKVGPCGVSFRRVARTLGLPQLMGGVIDDGDHFRVDAHG